jgi:general secretion pathway protein M
MTGDNRVARLLRRSKLVSTLLYAVVLGGLIGATALAATDMIERRRALKETGFLLAQLQARKGGNLPGALLGNEPPGSPFLEGPTVTVAGAALLQRVATAVQGVAGTIQSSSVDVNGSQTRAGFVSLLVSCELQQSALQKLLYDVEAGMPFLFVDQLDVQAPQINAATPDAGQKVRVVLGVSGQWQRSP